VKYKNILLFHTDLDGFGIYVLAQYFELPFDKFLSYDYGFEEEKDVVQILCDSENIVVADLTLTQALYDELVGKGKSVQIFDHHETSQWVTGKPGCCWDNKRCGTKLFFDEYIKPRVGRYKPVVREFVDLIDVYDRWDLSSPLRPMSEDLQRVFVKYGDWSINNPLVRHDRYITAMLRKLDNTEHFGWNNVELMYIQKAKESEEKAYQEAIATLQIRKDNKGRKFAVTSMWGKISMVCHRILNIDKVDIDYIVVAQRFHDTWGKISFRSREDGFNLIELAGVSGHKASAGAALSPDDARRFLNENLCFKYKNDLITEIDSIIEEANL